MWSLEAFRSLRLLEVEQAADTLAKLGFARGSILEIGAGSGWQAKSLVQHGYDVSAIDIPGSAYSTTREFPVQEYDGKQIPHPDESFDIVFSSNVLEHIAWIEEFQTEIQRVLKPGGVSIHLVPSASWRFWTTVLHPVYVVQYVVPKAYRKVRGAFVKQPIAVEQPQWAPQRSASRLGLLRTAIFTRRHGEFGNCLTEQYYFSRVRWNALFARTGWRDIRRRGNQLAYTAHGIFAGHLPLATRRTLSRFFGSSCHLYVMQKGSAALRPAKSAIPAHIAR